MTSLDEEAFEREICEWLVEHGGYVECKVGNQQGRPTHFDPVLGIDTAELYYFIGATQGDEWAELVKRYGGDHDVAQAKFAQRLAKEIDSRDTVDVLRHGVVDLGVTIKLAFFKPAHGLTPALLDRYAKNRLSVTRQLPFDPASTKTVDVCLFVNGLPVATAELKNRITGQSVVDAKTQYRSDRDPKNTTLARRAVVHFAADSEEVAMTTHLDGESTQFLPFNLGCDLGKGNPPNPDGHRTAYLWQRVWQRDAWLDLLQRFVHVDKPAKGSAARAKRRIIFPRYHQWDAVLALEAAARAEGRGHDYLVEHSAGSGKSNTIAWLAHRLSILHDANDAKVFDKVVVITDRKVLDKQLQDTIYQFEHAHGVVQKIDQNSAQLAAALAGQQARIIITTLQKFPVVLKSGTDLPNRRYAVIVDEAHSSQTGEAAKDLKLVLGDASPEQELTVAEAEDSGLVATPFDPVADALAAAVGARGQQRNLSFFAFTATPKGRTLELFGRLNPDSGKHEAFHLYSMRQAIEEGFILDVLANYVTYQTYWNIEKTIAEDPAYDAARAKSAIARFVSLHDHNLSQKAQIIVEHFRTHVRRKIGGRAKAMVVTASRLHAVRYKLALDKYCREHGYGDIGVLVAFSGTVVDRQMPYTESNMNAFPESQTAEQFDGDDWQVLVVAEKYQTGFDQPLLYAMYVDKALTGLAAVQTLSRLNRPCDGKDGTFVLDFRNDAEDIRTAFAPWYAKTVAPPSDPNLLYDTRHQLDEFGVLWPEEIETAVALLLGGTDRGGHGRFHGALAPTVDRFWALDDGDQDRFRDALNRFVRTYSFLSQIVAFTDTKLERDYLFCKALIAFVRSADGGGLDLGREVELSHLRIEQTFAGSVSLDSSDGEVSTVFSGTGKRHEAPEESLSQIIDDLNQRFGTAWTPEEYRGFHGRVADKLTEDPEVQQAAAVNTPENFMLLINKRYQAAVVDQMSLAEDMALKFIDDAEVKQAVLAYWGPLVYGKAKVLRQEHCLIGELIGPDLESQHLEYKATLRTKAVGGEYFKPLETAVLKTIAAFLNGWEGGTLLIGVANDATVHGLDSDYTSLHTDGKDDRDQIQLHLGNIVIASMGEAAAANLSTQLHTVEGHDICRVHVRPSGFPVDAKVVAVENGQHKKKTEFYIRIGNATRALNDVEKQKYVSHRWG